MHPHTFIQPTFFVLNKTLQMAMDIINGFFKQLEISVLHMKISFMMISFFDWNFTTNQFTCIQSKKI